METIGLSYPYSHMNNQLRMLNTLKLKAICFMVVCHVQAFPKSEVFLGNSVMDVVPQINPGDLPLRIQDSRDVSSVEFVPSSVKTKRFQENHHIISDCIYMTSEEGEYFFKNGNQQTSEVCGIYITSDPDQLIEIQFIFLEVPCDNGGLVVVVDGWELNGQLFPSPPDHEKPIKARFSEICGRRKVKKTFISSQNAALIQYRVPASGSSFAFAVRFVKNPYPCNALFQMEDTFTIRNYGKRSNCSLSAVFPASVRVLALNVGSTPTLDRGLQAETGTIHKCNKRGLDDFLQIGGSAGLDNYNMEVADSVCGLISKPAKRLELIACETTTVRLVSSGAFDNSATVSIKRLTDDELLNGHMSAFCIPEGLKK